jgi:hypothetical protein
MVDRCPCWGRAISRFLIQYCTVTSLLLLQYYCPLTASIGQQWHEGEVASHGRAWQGRVGQSRTGPGRQGNCCYRTQRGIYSSTVQYITVLIHAKLAKFVVVVVVGGRVGKVVVDAEAIQNHIR